MNTFVTRKDLGGSDAARAPTPAFLTRKKATFPCARLQRQSTMRSTTRDAAPSLTPSLSRGDHVPKTRTADLIKKGT